MGVDYKPWDHQIKAFNEVMENIENGIRSQLVVIPTRGGKSLVSVKLTEHFKKTGVVWFIAHTKILIDQMDAELHEHGIGHGVMAPWAPQLRYRVQVISKDTLTVRLHKLKAQGWPDPSLIIIDEAHMAMAKTYLNILKDFPDTLIVGFTGSACRLDNKPLKTIFEELVLGPQRSYLIKKKLLAPSETFAVKFNDKSFKRNSGGDYNQHDMEVRLTKPRVLADVADHWAKLAKGKKTLTFCATIKHCQDMAEEFNSRGFPSVAISSKDSRGEIRKKIEDFYSGKYINLCSVNLFLMGFTVKECECIIQARLTTSLMIYLQTIGRGGIYVPGKTLINIDAVNNWTRHGLPDDDRDWTAIFNQTAKKEKDQLDYKRCPRCIQVVPKSASVCPKCGHILAAERAPASGPEEVAGELVNVKSLGNYKEKQDLTLLLARGAGTLKEAFRVAKAHGFSTRQAAYVWRQTLKQKI